MSQTIFFAHANGFPSATYGKLFSALEPDYRIRHLEQRKAAHEALRSHRVMVLDVTSDELPAALVERYLAVKRDGVL